MQQGILERLQQGCVLGDGGYLLELEKRGHVQAGPFTPEVCIENPEALRQLHLEFLKAGAEVLQVLTFYASADKLATVGLQDKVDEINRSAVRIAKQAAAGSSALIAGNLSLTWVYDPKDPASADRVRRAVDQQLRVQMEEGVDFLIGETYAWLGEALLALERAKQTGLPVMITMSFDNKPLAYEGHDPAECARRLVDAGADIVGINCLRNPEHTLPLMAQIRAAVSGPIACQPAAYATPADQPDFTSLEAFPHDLEPLQLSRSAMGEYARQAQAMGIQFIGSCCGSVASHVREMARALGKRPESERSWRIDYDQPMSAYEYYKHGAAEPAP
ncbi:MAG TPA: homocysteine S-methyltransferase family protein [Acidobacteriota bacterium]